MTDQVLIQTLPSLDEYIIEVKKQVQVLIQTLPPLDEFISEVMEQVIVLSSTEEISSLHEIQQEHCESQVFDVEQFFSYPPHTYREHTCTPPVVCNDRTLSEFIKGEERCLKFINQDLTFLQSSNISSIFKCMIPVLIIVLKLYCTL